MRSLIFTFLLVSFISCKKNDLANACDVKDPIRELPWLAEMVEDARKNSQDMVVSKAVLKDAGSLKMNKKIQGFLVRTGSITFYYDCSGNRICESGGVTGASCDRYAIVKSEGVAF